MPSEIAISQARQPSRRDAVARSIATVTREIADTDAAIAACVADLDASPDSAALLEELDRLSATAAKQRGKLQALEHAMTIAADQDGAAVDAAFLDRCATAALSAKRASQKRIKVADAIEKTLATLRDQLAEFGAHDMECQGATRDSMKGLLGSRLFNLRGFNEAASLRVPMFESLQVALQQHLRDMPVLEMAQRAADRLSDRLDRGLDEAAPGAHSGPRDVVELIAARRGFYGGRMLNPGERFTFDRAPRIVGGKAPAIPEWAKPVGEYKAPGPVDHDIKPADAQAAVKRKTARPGEV